MKVQYVKADDWQVLYINGDLLVEGHEISIMEVLREIAWQWHKYDGELSVISYNLKQEWIEEKGNFVDEFSQIPDDVIEVADEIIFGR